MKKLSFLLLGATLFFAPIANAQLNFEHLIQAGPADAEKLVRAYTQPLLHGFGLGMNSGWTNTAQSLGPLHFDIRIVGTGSLVPTSKKTFDISQIGLSSNLRPTDPSKTITPTFIGDTKNNGPMVDLFDGNNNKLISFELPNAIIRNFIPTPQIQLTVGFFANTEFMIRAAPKVKLGEHFGSVSLLGFGVKHNIVRDFIPKEVKNTPFDLAIMVAYSRLKYSMPLDLQPLNGMVPENEAQLKDFTTQEIYAKFDNYIFQAVLSKQLSVFTPYISVGYSVSGASLGLNGNYPIVNSIRNNQLAYITYTDPFQLKETYLKTFKGDVGLQIKLPILRLYASYGFSGGFGMVSGGIGLGI
ncbi:MAG: hypothetical protein EOO86_15770 [Pedobacter sp.]|nr:MAG: hypothetical protein EOO86_15770 [Pedobacter sp.]